jgi:chemotaxis protein CheD
LNQQSDTAPDLDGATEIIDGFTERSRQKVQKSNLSEKGLRSYLHPGQLFVSAAPYSVTTILGSCVAVCMHDPLLKSGGIVHYLLPYKVSLDKLSLRIGSVAINALIGKLLALGSRKENLQAKLFGGACVIEAFRSRENHLGAQNVELARSLLSNESIPVVAEDVGGAQARKLIFQVEDGTVWVKQL